MGVPRGKHSDRVVVAHTFAKTLGPGPRLGRLIAPEWPART
ncbi:hypothetical protein ACFTZK_19115 [Streptomyces decoyicus]